MKNTRMWVILALLTWAGEVWAENIEWIPGRDIDCPVPVSTQDTKRFRTVKLPCQTIVTWAGAKDAHGLTVEKINNTLIFVLRETGIESQITVYDEDNNTYTLQVRAPVEGENPDTELNITKSKAAVVGRPEGARNEDSDQAVMELLAKVWQGRPDDTTAVTTLQSEGRGGKTTKGQVWFNSDDLTITCLRVWRTETLYAYDLSYVWHSPKPVTLELQRIWMTPGVLGITSSGIDGKNPSGPLPVLSRDTVTRVVIATDAGLADMMHKAHQP